MNLKFLKKKTKDHNYPSVVTIRKTTNKVSFGKDVVDRIGLSQIHIFANKDKT